MLGKNEKHPSDIMTTKNCFFKSQRFTGKAEDDMAVPEFLRLYSYRVLG